MGTIDLERLPEFFEKWAVRYETVGDWLTVGRSSGGFDDFCGVIVHHTATKSTTPLSSTIRYALNGPDHPIANGCVSRDYDGPKVVLWAGLASNHAGRGGPKLSSRGVIGRDAANRVSFGMEAENNGIDEPWPDDQCDLYVRAVAAIIDWANECTPGAPLGAGDVWAHREWAPSRKSDPAGPSKFNSYQAGAWNMDAFRGEVFLTLVAGPNPLPPPECSQPATSHPGDTGDVVVELQTLLQADGWYPYTIDGNYGPRTGQGVQQMQKFLREQGAYEGPLDGIYGEWTRGSLCAFMAVG